MSSLLTYSHSVLAFLYKCRDRYRRKPTKFYKECRELFIYRETYTWQSISKLSALMFVRYFMAQIPLNQPILCQL